MGPVDEEGGGRRERGRKEGGREEEEGGREEGKRREEGRKGDGSRTKVDEVLLRRRAYLGSWVSVIPFMDSLHNDRNTRKQSFCNTCEN